MQRFVMLIDQGFATDPIFDGLSAAARGVYAGVAACLRLSRRESISEAVLPVWIAKETSALAELEGCGALSVAREGSVALLALAPLGCPFAVASMAAQSVTSEDGEESPEDRKRRLQRDRTEKSRRNAKERDSSVTESVTDTVTERYRPALPTVTESVTGSVTPRVSERREEKKREEEREIRERDARVTSSVTESVTDRRASVTGSVTEGSKSVTGSVTLRPDTPGERTPLRDAHRATIPPWALQQVEMDAIGTGKRPDDVRAVWERFVDHWISDGKLSASWAAEWRKWLGNQRMFAAEKAAKAPVAPPRVDLLAEAQKRQAAAANAVQPTKEELDEMIAAVGQKQGAA